MGRVSLFIRVVSGRAARGAGGGRAGVAVSLPWRRGARTPAPDAAGVGRRARAPPHK